MSTIGTGAAYDRTAAQEARLAATSLYQINYQNSLANTVSNLICGAPSPRDVAAAAEFEKTRRPEDPPPVPKLPKLYPDNCSHRDALSISNTERVGPKRVQGVLKHTVENLRDMAGGRFVNARAGPTPLMHTTLNSQGQSLPYSAVFPRKQPAPRLSDRKAFITGAAVGSRITQIPWHTRANPPKTAAEDGKAEMSRLYDPLTTSPPGRPKEYA